jgi:hypothetical protein
MFASSWTSIPGYFLKKKLIAYVKNEGSNFNAITNALKSDFVTIHCLKKKHHQRTKKNQKNCYNCPQNMKGCFKIVFPYFEYCQV